MKTPEAEIKKYIHKARYDNSSTMIWAVNEKDELQYLLDVRGWGHIQNLFKTEQEAYDFQDDLGEWITQAINEKLSRTATVVHPPDKKIAYKFFEKKECRVLSENSIQDERGFVFVEGIELKVDIEKEKKEDVNLPTHSKGSGIRAALFEGGIKLNHLPESPYQYFPCGDEYEPIIFQVEIIGLANKYKIQSRSTMYAEHIRVLKKITHQEMSNIHDAFDKETKTVTNKTL